MSLPALTIITYFFILYEIKYMNDLLVILGKNTTRKPVCLRPVHMAEFKLIFGFGKKRRATFFEPIGFENGTFSGFRVAIYRCD